MESVPTALSEETAAARPGFWTRQITMPATRRQNVFDVIVGIVLLALSLRFDPIVFRGALGGLFSPVQLFAYGEFGLAMFALALWLWLGRRVGIAGIILGLIMIVATVMPLAVASLFAYLAALHFTEFVARLFAGRLAGFNWLVFLVFGLVHVAATFVYFRNAERALRSVEVRRRGWAAVLFCFAAGLALLAFPVFMQWNAAWSASECIAAIRRDDPEAIVLCTDRLKRWHWYGQGTADRLVSAYLREPGRTVVHARLAAVYRQVTGDEIEARIQAIVD